MVFAQIKEFHILESRLVSHCILCSKIVANEILMTSSESNCQVGITLRAPVLMLFYIVSRWSPGFFSCYIKRSQKVWVVGSQLHLAI